MSNPAFPDLLKIGQSSKDPTIDRIEELNTTGVPYPFKCEYYAFVEDHIWLEKAVHIELSKYRANNDREFFKVDCSKAINFIRKQANDVNMLKYEQVFFITPEALRKEQEKELLMQRERLEKERLQKEQAKLAEKHILQRKAAQQERERIVLERQAQEEKERNQELREHLSILLKILTFFALMGLLLYQLSKKYGLGI